MGLLWGGHLICTQELSRVRIPDCPLEKVLLSTLPSLSFQYSSMAERAPVKGDI